MTPTVVLVISYLLGAIPFGYIIVRAKEGADIRREGSGNIGAANVVRTRGWALGAPIFALDVAKGALAVFLAKLFVGGSPWIELSAIAVIIGHSYPIFLKFRGGKSVATGCGAFAVLHPVALVAALAVFVVSFAISRYISLGSICAAGALTISSFFIKTQFVYTPYAAVLSAILIIYRHKENISRLIAGRENPIWGAKR